MIKEREYVFMAYSRRSFNSADHSDRQRDRGRDARRHERHADCLPAPSAHLIGEQKSDAHRADSARGDDQPEFGKLIDFFFIVASELLHIDSP